jgi:hypothetical protein
MGCLQNGKMEGCVKVKGKARMKTYSLKKTSPPWWPRGLMRGVAATRLLRMRIRNRSGVWMSVSYECCILPGRGLCDGLIPRQEESYPVCLCVSVCVTEFFRRNSNLLRLQCVGRRSQTKKERNQEGR